MQPQIAQQPDQQGRACRAIDVIVAEDAHIFLTLYGVGQALGRHVHVAKQAGIGHETADRGIAMRVQPIARATARQQ